MSSLETALARLPYIRTHPDADAQKRDDPLPKGVPADHAVRASGHKARDHKYDANTTKAKLKG